MIGGGGARRGGSVQGQEVRKGGLWPVGGAGWETLTSTQMGMMASLSAAPGNFLTFGEIPLGISGMRALYHSIKPCMHMLYTQ